MKNRSAVRVAVLSTGALLPVVVAASPVFATVTAAGERYPALGVTNTILLFVVTPLAIFFVVSGLAVLPSTLAQRRAPKRAAWAHEPIWIGAQAETVAAIEQADDQPKAISAVAFTPEFVIPSTPQRDLVPVGTAPRTARGGASAEW